MKNAPATDQSNKSAGHYSTLVQAQNAAIKTLLQINHGKLPLPTMLNMLEAQGFDRAEIRQKLNALGDTLSISFRIEPIESKPFQNVSVFVLGADHAHR